MTERSEHAHARPGAEPPGFAHAVAVADLAETGGLIFDLVPDEDERAAIAAYLDVDGIEELGFRGSVEPAGDGWSLSGKVRARVVQSCVVTLDPVESAIEADVARLYMPGVGVPEGAEVELGEDDENAPEPLGREIDLAVPMIETLALSIDPFPRSEGAEHGGRVYAPPGAEPLTDEAAHPFAGLAGLRSKLGKGGE